MTTKEIIDILQLAQSCMEWEYSMEFAAAVDETIEIIQKSDKKETPIKPTYDETTKKLICPKCNKEVNGNYCSNCGQRME